MKNIFHCVWAVFAIALAGCTGMNTTAPRVVGTPIDIVSDFANTTVPTDVVIQKRVAVLLPLSGDNAAVGADMKAAIEMAFIGAPNSGVSATFFDMSGTQSARQNAAAAAFRTNPDLVLGPITADDARIAVTQNTANVPEITYSSDAAALSDNVYSVALIPTQSAENVATAAVLDGNKNIVIFAPDTKFGYAMANAAINALSARGVSAAGLYYYTENDMGSEKAAAAAASAYDMRAAAATRAKEILSDVTLNTAVSADVRADASAQLDKLNKADTVGRAPFDAALLLGTANDSRAIVSFLRYFDITRGVHLYGTAIWDAPDMYSDITMMGAQYAALATENTDFIAAFTNMTGRAPLPMASFAYDSARIAIRSLRSATGTIPMLTNPSGFYGLNGAVRIMPNGVPERAMAIMKLNASGAPAVVASAPADFRNIMYSDSVDSSRPRTVSVDYEINPADFITLPASVMANYHIRTISTTPTDTPVPTAAQPVQVAPDTDVVAADPDWTNDTTTVEKTLL